MERTRIDIAGGSPAPTSSTRSTKSTGTRSLSQPKSIVMLSIAGGALLLAGYLIYSTFFSTAPASDVADTALESTFESAANAPQPPPADSTMTYEKAGGKRVSP